MAHVKVKVHYSENQFDEFDYAYEEGFAFAVKTILEEKFKNEKVDIGVTYFPDAPGERFKIVSENRTIIDQVRGEISKINQLYVETAE